MELRTNKPNRKGLNFIVDGGDTLVKLYDTIIIKTAGKVVELNTGGFKTNHTKNCMNDFLNEFGISVYQSKNIWYVENNNDLLEFSDNMKIVVDTER